MVWGGGASGMVTGSGFAAVRCAPVAHADLARGKAGETEVVGDDDESGAGFAVEVEEHVLDAPAGFAVKVAGRFVGEEDLGRVDEGAGEGNALLLAAGELNREMVEPLAETDLFKKRAGLGAVGAARTEFEGDEDVLQRGERREELEVLEDETDAFVAEGGAGVFGKVVQATTIEGDGTGGRGVETGAETEQGRLTTPGGADDGHGVARLDGKVDVVEDGEGAAGDAVGFGETVGFEEGHEGGRRRGQGIKEQGRGNDQLGEGLAEWGIGSSFGDVQKSGNLGAARCFGKAGCCRALEGLRIGGMKRRDASVEGMTERAEWVRRISCLGMLLGMLLSWKVWISERVFPLAPVWDAVAGWPHAVAGVLYAVALLLLAAMVVWPRGGRGMRGTLGVWLMLMLVLFLQDQMRWQPWAYQYVLCLIPFLFAERNERALLLAARVIFIATYVWGGLHKLGTPFARFFETTLAKSLLADAGEVTRTLVLGAGQTIPFAEILIGVLLVVPKSRKFGVLFACLMHAGILLWKGPFGDASNSVIWPWNACMIVLVILLFPKGEAILPAKEKAGSPSLRVVTVIIVILVGIMPLFSLFGRWPRYLSFHLYSGHQQRMLVGLKPSGKAKLGEAFRPSIRESANWPGYSEIEGMTWAFDDLNVPLVSDDDVILQIAKQLVARGGLTDNDGFVYIDYPMLLKERGWRRYLPSEIATMEEFGPPTR